MIVVDTNIIAYFYIPGTYTDMCVNVFKKDNEWMAPFLWRSEFCNVLSLYVRKKIISAFEAINIVNKVQLQMFEGEQEVSAAEVLHLANKSSCSAYDCEYVALAQKLNVPLLTFDKKMLREFKKTALHPSMFIN